MPTDNLLKGDLYVHYDMIKTKFVNDDKENDGAIICQMKYGDLIEKQLNADFIISAINHYKKHLARKK